MGDEVNHRENIRSLLLQAGLNAVDTAGSGPQALLMLDQKDYSLVLSDLLMPGLDGIQFIQQLSLRPCPPRVAVVSSSSSRLIAGAIIMAKSLGVVVIGQISKSATAKEISGLVSKLHACPGNKQVSGHPEQIINLQELKRAIVSHQMKAWFQPKMRISDGAVTSAEALARWVQSDGTVLLPGQFLPTLIQAGLEEDLLTLMLQQTVESQLLWRKQGYTVQASVNLPTHLLNDWSLPDRLYSQVIEHGGRPSAISFELTETSMTDTESDFYAGACRLRMKGFGLAQDDSGQGYSSLFKIASTPFTEVKVDRSLIERCGTEEGARAAVESIIFLGRRLGMDVVAEGVESREQISILRNLKCPTVQGFLISQALNDKLFCTFLENRGAITNWGLKR
ncbi:TPA: EAL domain-containing response regulator [Stenotrophomonas maltophilia]|nr:EAL domain-containing response regulator [Stenotrophomonas maltophilia]